MTHQRKPAASPGTRRALVHNAITKALSDAGDWVPLSVRLTATRAALAEVDAWHAAEPDAACAHCGSSDHTWDDCEAYTRLVADDEPAPAAVSAAVAPPTNDTHGLSVQHADALYDAIATPGPARESFDDQHARVCAVVRQILDDLLPTPAEPTDRAAVLHEVADELTRKANKLTERVHDLAYFVAKDRLREAEILDREATELRRMADETATETPHTCDNCHGIDPDTCLNNPTRPPEQCPCSEGDGYGLQCQKPAGHNLCTFEEQPAAGARQDGAET